MSPVRAFFASGSEAAARWRLAVCSALFAGHAWWLACVAEDSYISFRFARHLAAGHGFRWNPGEPPVEGFTNLLWVLLAALVELLGLDVVRTLQVAGVAAGIGVLWLTDRFAARVLGLAGAARAVPVLLLAASGPLATWAASGLETVPFTLFVLAALYGSARYRRDGGGRHLTLAWIAAALAALTRPEGVLAAGVVALASLARRDGRRRAWPAAGLFAAFLLVLTLARLAYFGAALPNTFYAKTGGGLLQVLRGLVYSGFFAFHYLVPLAPLLIAGLVGKGRVSGRETTPAAALAAWCLGWTAYVVAVGGDYMAMYRFFVPVVPALALLAGVAAARVRPVPAAAGLVVLAAAGTFVHSTPLEAELFEKPPRQHGTFRGVETERWHVARLRLLARVFAARSAGRPGASLATGAIGILGWESGLAIHDLHGLVDPRIARAGASDEPLGTGLPGHEKSDLGHVLAKRPTYWMWSRSLRDRPAGWPRYEPEVLRELHEHYELRHLWLVDEENGEAGYFSFLERQTPFGSVAAGTPPTTGPPAPAGRRSVPGCGAARPDSGDPRSRAIEAASCAGRST